MRKNLPLSLTRPAAFSMAFALTVARPAQDGNLHRRLSYRDLLAMGGLATPHGAPVGWIGRLWDEARGHFPVDTERSGTVQWAANYDSGARGDRAERVATLPPTGRT